MGRTSLFDFVANLAIRNSRLLVLIWLAAAVVSLPLAFSLPDKLKGAGFANPSMEAEQTHRILERDFDFPKNPVFVVYRSEPGAFPDSDLAESILNQLESVTALTEVASITTFRDDLGQVSPDGSVAYAIVAIDLPDVDAHRSLPKLRQALRNDQVEVVLTGGPVFYSDIQEVSESDLRRAELITLPLAFVVLVIVFGSLISAGLPVLIGGIAVVVSLAGLAALSGLSDQSIFALNLVTMLGLGLGADYSLLIVDRFREELGQHSVEEAVRRTLATAGRAVLFSALTVSLGMATLISFPFMFFRSLGISGVLVTALACLTALTLLPALICLLGRRIDRFAIRSTLARPQRVRWQAMAERVMRHALPIALATTVFLLVLGIPSLGLRASLPDSTMLPSSAESRRGFEVLSEAFHSSGDIQIWALVDFAGRPALAPESMRQLDEFIGRLKADQQVSNAVSVASLDPRMNLDQHLLLFSDWNVLSDPLARRTAEALVRDSRTLVGVASKGSYNDPATLDLVNRIRNTAAEMPFEMSLGGSAAFVQDIVSTVYGNFPRAIIGLVVVTYLCLLVLFRSAVLPLKAILMNFVSLGASYGALVVIFQNGLLSSILGFEARGFVDATVPVVMFCVLFGLSMDYEVFLLSRVAEYHSNGLSNERSVSKGLAATGQVVTSAAVIVILVASSFVTADIVLVKAIGLGVAIAVTIDATLVRFLLVPSMMKLLGEYNWWLPSFLSRLMPSEQGER